MTALRDARWTRLVAAALIATGASVAAWHLRHRRSTAVRSWRPSNLPRRRIGALSCRTGGAGESGVLLLHGLVATGDIFGTIPDRLAHMHCVAVPDLLGFGASLDEQRSDFGTAAHLQAIGRVVDEAFGGRRLRIGAHSMGSALALRWATANPERVALVVCFGAPMWPTNAAARRSLASAGPMARSFLTDTRVARRICEFNCRHRTLSGWIAAVLAPRWPSDIARQASQHTWPAYRQAMEQQILHDDWASLLSGAAEAGIEVHLVWGRR